MQNTEHTPHINASKKDFAKTVLMPGDPLRSKFIAENFLNDATLINNVRGIQGYTGFYKGKKVSVMASGMGMPSISIYSYELFNFFGVENIIRVGSAGAIADNVNIGDIIIGMGASTNSNYIQNFKFPGSFSPLASYPLMKEAINQCNIANVKYHVGNIFSSDIFYAEDENVNNKFAEMGILAVEMEAAALYANAARYNKNALAICTVSDHIIKKEGLSAEERQNGFSDMIKIALETASYFGAE